MNRRLHLLVSLLLSALLLVSAATGLVLSGASLSEQLGQLNAPGDSVAVVAERVSQQLPNVERLERSANGTLLATLGGDVEEPVHVVDPATGEDLGPYAPSATLDWLRDLHRELLLGSTGRWLSGLAALALALLSISGAILLARRLGGWRRLLTPIRSAEGVLHWHTVVARWALPGLAVLALSGLYLSATSLDLLGDGSDNEPAWPEGIQAAAHLPLGALAALRQVELAELRELEFPSAADDTHFFSVRTASGSGFVNAASGQWISFQRNSTAQNLYETAYALHTGEGMPVWSMALAALALSTLFLGGSGLLGWWQRRGRVGEQDTGVAAEQAEAVILVGSQSGSTWAYARQLQTQLQAAGRPVHVAAMNDVQDDYPQARCVLVLAATYGDGQAPDSAGQFLERLAEARWPARGLPVAVLGFGDRQFPRFCAYAEAVEQALQQRGCQPLLPLQRIDRQTSGELNAWAGQLGERLGTPLRLQSALAPSSAVRLTLQQRQCYSERGGQPAVVLRFAVAPGSTHFAPGDLLAIRPPVEAAQDDTAPRLYSIASADDDGFVEICVRLHPQGLCSNYLHDLKPGAEVAASIQAHPGFRPQAGEHPVLLIGAGVGVAPLIGFVRKNQSRRPIQLYWGGRHASDQLYGEELQQCLADGRLQRLQRAFSQGPTPGYVQDSLHDDAASVRTLLQQGAQVLVCGSREMAAGVRAVLETLLAEMGSNLDQLKAQGRFREDVY
ncbi:PepSY domain-containing protein [Pseudomonas sp. MAP12]|uniref:PepSY domain-containing protein n=1 Tax=Geopseudomonas aromaticivorans TaxID=2849492 RepID=A0ABS6MS96_9GAMM|nr:PepSY domain-containing protein [Pseudomonas aromaticivorans]MBV2131676.1 PepSY domain-containing protein [Pseudomonas aromaticivorans]